MRCSNLVLLRYVTKRCFVARNDLLEMNAVTPMRKNQSQRAQGCSASQARYRYQILSDAERADSEHTEAPILLFGN